MENSEAPANRRREHKEHHRRSRDIRNKNADHAFDESSRIRTKLSDSEMRMPVSRITPNHFARRSMRSAAKGMIFRLSSSRMMRGHLQRRSVSRGNERRNIAASDREKWQRQACGARNNNERAEQTSQKQYKEKWPAEKFSLFVGTPRFVFAARGVAEIRGFEAHRIDDCQKPDVGVHQTRDAIHPRIQNVHIKWDKQKIQEPANDGARAVNQRLLREGFNLFFQR